MKHTYYTISDTAKKLDVEAHVLRYWEEELNLDIHRNELGHRSYSDGDIKTFENIKLLKDEGFSLQDIKSALPKLSTYQSIDSEAINEIKKDLKAVSIIPKNRSSRLASSNLTPSGTPSSSGSDKLEQFREIMNSIINQAISDNNRQLAKAICDQTSERIIKEMNYLFRTLDEDEDIRIKQLEAAIEAASLARIEAAASKSAKKRHFFRKTGQHK